MSTPPGPVEAARPSPPGLPHPFAVGAVVVAELTGAGPHYGHAAVALVAHAAVRPDGYLVGCSLLSLLLGELPRQVSGGGRGSCGAPSSP